MVWCRYGYGSSELGKACQAFPVSAQPLPDYQGIVTHVAGCSGDLDLLHSLDRDQAHPARTEFWRYGKGHDRAGLKLGDCFSFALAKWLDGPLLFNAADFSHTDT